MNVEVSLMMLAKQLTGSEQVPASQTGHLPFSRFRLFRSVHCNRAMDPVTNQTVTFRGFMMSYVLRQDSLADIRPSTGAL